MMIVFIAIASRIRGSVPAGAARGVVGRRRGRAAGIAANWPLCR